MPRKRQLPSKSKRVKALARKRLGTVKPARPLEESPQRAKPKHKKPIHVDE